MHTYSVCVVWEEVPHKVSVGLGGSFKYTVFVVFVEVGFGNEGE